MGLVHSAVPKPPQVRHHGRSLTNWDRLLCAHRDGTRYGLYLLRSVDLGPASGGRGAAGAQGHVVVETHRVRGGRRSRSERGEERTQPGKARAGRPTQSDRHWSSHISSVNAAWLAPARAEETSEEHGGHWLASIHTGVCEWLMPHHLALVLLLPHHLSSVAVCRMPCLLLLSMHASHAAALLSLVHTAPPSLPLSLALTPREGPGCGCYHHDTPSTVSSSSSSSVLTTTP